jgi:hypothetical protein
MARVDLSPKFHGGRPGFSLTQRERVIESPTHPASRVLPFWASFIQRVRGVLGFRGASRPRYKEVKAVRSFNTDTISGGVQAEQATDFVAGANGTGKNGTALSLTQRRVTAASTAKPGYRGKLRGPFGLTAFTRPGKLVPMSKRAKRAFGYLRKPRMRIAGKEAK